MCLAERMPRVISIASRAKLNRTTAANPSSMLLSLCGSLDNILMMHNPGRANRNGNDPILIIALKSFYYTESNFVTVTSFNVGRFPIERLRPVRVDRFHWPGFRISFLSFFCDVLSTAFVIARFGMLLNTTVFPATIDFQANCIS